MNGIKRIGIAAIAAVLMLFVGGASAPCSAQGSCSEGCRAAFAACYRSTSNRAACEGQLQRCLQGCVASKGG
jgi:hypothetical protein